MKKALVYASVGLFALSAGHAHAQNVGTPGAAEETQAGPAVADAGVDIVVTAQKRAERLIDVPIAISVVTAETLQNRRIESVGDLAQAVPSLTFTPSINEQNNNLRVRGIGTALFNQGIEPSVSYVLDGVVLARQGQGIQDLIDIDRIEVLRGPQGTLFGKNATAGLINIVTRRPSDSFGVMADATIAELDEYRFRASVTGSIAPRLAARVTGFYNDVGGHIRNVFTGRDVNGSKSYGGRAQLEFKSGSGFNLLLIGDYRRSEQECCQWQSVRAETPLYRQLLGPVVPSRNNRSVNTNGAAFNNTEQWGVSLQGELPTAIGTVTSITAYRWWNFAANNDADSIPTTTPIFGGPGGIGSFNVNTGRTTIRQFSQELRLASDGGGRFNYTLGLYYFNLDLDRSLERRLGFCIPAPGNPANAGLTAGRPCVSPLFQSRLATSNAQNNNYAAFGQFDWEAVDRLILTAGFRLQRDEVSFTGTRPAAASPNFPTDAILGATFIGGAAANAGGASAGDTDFSGRLSARYEFSRNVQTYFSYTRGYKGQGFDVEPTTNFANQAPVRPEKVDAFELGFKSSFDEGRFGLNAALFHSQYRDLQVQASIDTGGLRAFVPTNAGKSISKGIELEMVARPSRAFTTTAGLTILDAKADVDGLNCIPGAVPTVVAAGGAAPSNACFRFSTDAATANRQNIRGGQLPNAPRYRLSLTGRYDDVVEAVGLRLFAQGSLVYQSDITYSLEQDPLLREDGYPIVDASIGFGAPDRKYTVTLFARNLLNQNFAASLFRNAIWGSSATVANVDGFFTKESRRYIGGNLRVQF